jgi:UDP-N-acetylglucosamine 4,6-dehydratase
MWKTAIKLRHMGLWRKRWLLIAYDVVAMLFALWASFSVRLGILYSPESAVVVSALISACLSIGALFLLDIYRIVLRFFDLGRISRILFGAAIAAAIWVMIVYFMRPAVIEEGKTILVPRSIGLIYCGFLFTLLFVGRYLMAGIVSRLDQRWFEKPTAKKLVVIYGANPAGVRLGDSVQMDRAYKLCAFVDDDPALHNRVALGVPILSPDELTTLVETKSIAEVFLAIPNASRAQRLAVVSRLSEFDIEIKTIPAPEEIVSGRFTISDIRQVDVNDLLRRDPVLPLTELIRSSVDGCSILVTGAGGSIGSEICRQIARGSPQKIVLLEHSEFALYTIQQQLLEQLEQRSASERPEVVSVVGSILNEQLVRDVIAREHVDSIYHAAAYKHVPLLEHNEIAGVENNVLGTFVVASAAADAGLSRFTMISTDKAVRPSNLMGASKRLAELVVQALAARAGGTRFGIVRFGNVLDSSGSVVQLFRTQIQGGGPVTVTHRDVTRFFMSIPEATQLVLQAGAMAEQGEVFVLDMGEPVLIDELARNMIRLSGMTVRDEENPLGDIEIAYVGMRPGEKLYEELFIGGEVVPTEHPRIRKAIERSLSLDEVGVHLERLKDAVRRRDARQVRAVLRDVIEPETVVAVAKETPGQNISWAAASN